MKGPEQEVTELRQQIDQIDREMVALLDRRMRFAKEIGARKQRAGSPIPDPEREALVLRQAMDEASCLGGTLSESDIVLILGSVMQVSRRKQEEGGA